MSVTLRRCWSRERNHRAWCDESGEDFHYALCVAGKHYLAELNDEQTEERRMP